MPGSVSTVPKMPCRFVDRDDELRSLSRASEKGGLVVVYGRRRVGKTRLVLEWLRREGLRHVFYVSHLTSHEHNLRLMAERAAEQLGDPIIREASPKTLTALMGLVLRAGAEAVVIDEFTYWAKASPRVLSEMQEFVDQYLPRLGGTVVITGSVLGVMMRGVLGGGSPLYGRAVARLRLGPLRFPYLKDLLPKLSPVERVATYSLVGGIPFYLCALSSSSSIEEVIEYLIASPTPLLLDEKDLILREEFRDPHTYAAILSAIAKGYGTPAKIAQVTGIDSSHTHKYLAVLEYLGIVKRSVPLFKKKGRYVIADPVIRTWYTLIEPVTELIEMGEYGKVKDEVLRRLPTHTAPTWESLVREYLLRKYLPQGFTVAGRLEHKGAEVDVVILNTSEKKAVVAEVEWSSGTLRDAERLADEARRKAEALLPSKYEVVATYAALREVKGGPSGNVITPETVESG